jgi:hypothetical protein
VRKEKFGSKYRLIHGLFHILQGQIAIVKYVNKQFLFKVEFVTHLYSRSQNSITINNILKRIYIVSKQVLFFFVLTLLEKRNSEINID